ncbi:MAG: thermonuclease family protein [Pseudomonadota bacterium]
MKTFFLASLCLGALSGFVLPLGSGVGTAIEMRTLVGEADVTDGDSLRIASHRVRLYGIDAVERGQSCLIEEAPWACGQDAKRALQRLVEDRTVVCQVKDSDRGRLIAQCTAGGVDLGRQMVRRGWAVAYTRYSSAYVQSEALARAEGLALWRSNFTRPEAYRAAQRARQTSAAASQDPPSLDCVIKGNVSRGGARIFHVPGQQFYSRTSIDEARGERWFCSPEQARQSGWRAALR